MAKANYETPTVTLVGSFEEVTQGTVGGAKLDAAIPVGTPLASIPGFAASHTS